MYFQYCLSEKPLNLGLMGVGCVLVRFISINLK